MIKSRKQLKKELKEAELRVKFYKGLSDELKEEKSHLNDVLNSLIPVKMSICRQRKKTYVRFNDGTLIDVKCCKDDKFTKETGLAYCVMKKLISQRHINNLLKKCKELKVGEDIREKI